MKAKTFALVGAAGALALVAVDASGAVTYTFNINSAQVMETVVGSFASLPAEPFSITNNTGASWIGFDVALVGRSMFGDYPFMRFVDLGDPGIYVGPGTAVFEDVNTDPMGYNEVMRVTGLSVPNGGTLSFTVDIFGGVFPEGLDEFDIVGRPTVASGGDPDFDGDNMVGFSDLTRLLGEWGFCVGCLEDLDGNNMVGFSDLTLLLGAWGPV